MKKKKNYFYFLIFFIIGIGYFSLVDHWQFYRGSYEKIWEWMSGSRRQEESDKKGQMAGMEEFGEQSEEEFPVILGESASLDYLPNSFVPGEGENPESSPLETLSKEELNAENPQKEEIRYQTVEDDYFSDAVFIGDSRTVGMYEYGMLQDIASFYASTGLTIYKLFDANIVTVEGQKKKISVEEALSTNQYKKIYLMIGINEMGTGTVESFAKKYEETVAHLLELQPEAILYIQAIMKVTTTRSNQGDYITNEGIDARNEKIAELADGERIFFLDVNEGLTDEDGGLTASYTFDGVHLKAQYIELWKNFLKSHAVFLDD